MTLKLEVGKYYKTRDGRKASIIRKNETPDNYLVDHIEQGYQLYHYPSGKSNLGDRRDDLIAEWTDAPTGPVRTVTRKEIVPGVYGSVVVGVRLQDGAIAVGFSVTGTAVLNPAELRAAIATLTEIADALEADQ